ncbi:hypothetical protein [uncultured Roseovarius sp.]|uniref:hypothetical protein n=1 Tax=uncultured Roseovarius sp. TaxID=293344 RepID=UPI00262052B3|nr:hypothetical protein [uncultured Roseovarius sp.]
MIRLFALCGLAILAACTNPNDLDEAPVYLGNFHLGHNVVVAPNLTKGPASREASKDEWIAAMTEAMTDRFSRYNGTQLYHLGVSIEGYVLAVPGVPVVASPKSALILNVTAWDDAAGAKLNDKPHLVTVLESFSGSTFLGSGLTQSKEKQIENLSRNAAKQIQNWLEQQNDKLGWFEDDGVPANEKDPSELTRPAAAETEAAEASEAPDPAARAVQETTVIEEPPVAPVPAE